MVMASAARNGAAAAALITVAVSVLALAAGGSAQLQYGFYRGKCNGNDVEAVVKSIVGARFARENPVVAHLLRMQFHECAINGCDGGLLIDGPNTEKTALPNQSVKGYDLIATIKSELERRCPGVVSCSDIQILATRDAVAMAGGGAPYPVRTGRRDRRRSLASDVSLPKPEFTAAQTVAYFGRMGMSPTDTVLLLGAGHTVGVTHCSAIKNSRLYRYGGRAGATDPTMDPATASLYKSRVCPNVPASDSSVVFLDDTALKMDNNYFKNLKLRRGVLACDQNLYSDASTRGIVDRFAANGTLFASSFPKALVKLGEVNVLTGTQGEIRKVCNKFN